MRVKPPSPRSTYTLKAYKESVVRLAIRRRLTRRAGSCINLSSACISTASRIRGSTCLGYNKALVRRCALSSPTGSRSYSRRERISALVLSLPGRYIIIKEYSASSSA